MEGEGIGNSTVLSSSPHDPDIIAVESSDHADPRVQSPPSDDDNLSAPVVLTDDLRDKIIKQIEYYFSDENLPTDKYMMSLIKKSKEGFVPIGIVASFRKMKKLVQEKSLIVAALRRSSLLVVSSDGKKVKRLHPLPSNEVKDSKLCTVLVENLPEDHSVENIQRIFEEAGSIKNIYVRDPHSVEESTKGSKTEKLISGKLHVLVVYETVEAADNAVARLNNEDDWRNGMRVKLLKQMGKYGQRKKAWREPDPERNGDVRGPNQAGDEEYHNSSEHHDETPDEEDGEHLSKDTNGHRGNGHRGRRRGSKGQKYHGTNGKGHGTTSTHIVEASKPPPGPRMPDGTRGFTMGRGRPLVLNQN